MVGIAQAGLLLWLLTLPLVMARFHILSLVALVLNVLLWPLMSVSLLSGFGVLLFGTICPPLGSLCGWLCDGSFWLLEGGVNLGASAAVWPFLAARSGRLVAVGILRRFGIGGRVSAASPAATLVRRHCWPCGSPLGFGGLGLAARSQPARLHVSQRGPRLRGVHRVSLGPDDALRRRPDGRTVGRAHARFPNSSGIAA